LWMMGTETPEQFGTALRWVHVPAFALIVGLVCFVRTYLGTGRWWLAWTTCSVRAFSLLLNFLMEPNVNYREITRLRHIPFLGDSVSVCEGVPSLWNLVGHLSLLLLVIFVADAAVQAWRRGGRREALVVGGSFLFFVLAATVQTMLTRWHIFHWPETASLFFMAIVASMAYELSREAVRAAQLSEDLIESEARYRGIFDGAIEGIFRTSWQGKSLVANPALAKMLGYDSVEDAVLTIEDSARQAWADPDERSRFVRLFEGREAVRGYECQLKRKDGTKIWVSLSSRKIRGAEGQEGYLEGFVQDITERKRAEQEIERQRNELAHVTRVSALGQLASSLAHELNQPLGAILRNAEAAELFLQDPSPDFDELRAIFADIRKDDQRAGEVIDRMRALIKNREGAKRRRLDLRLLAGDTVALVRPDAEMRRVELKVETGPAVPLVYGDQVQLQQVLLNLLLNAMDALDDNPPAKRFVTVRAQPAGAMVEVTVSDTGHGIPADKLPHVFEPFFSSKPDGLGMGLAISRDIVWAHGGRLWAENNPDGGATFHFTVPVNSAGQEARDQ
jgi:two-component system, LuxR family, sensor kinase FixL